MATTRSASTRLVEAFVDDLSNWYVRRNRRRFWKGALDDDKRAAYATLHEVLTTLVRILAPIVPHLADAIWGNLVAAVDADAPDSVHLADFPERGERPARRGDRRARSTWRAERSRSAGRRAPRPACGRGSPCARCG